MVMRGPLTSKTALCDKIDTQQLELDRLKVQLAALKAQVKAAGMTPVVP